MLVNSAWTHSGKGKDMARKKHRAEEIIPKLRAMEVHIAKGLKADEAARKEGITEQTYYRWRREYGGLKVDQVKRLKELAFDGFMIPDHVPATVGDSPWHHRGRAHCVGFMQALIQAVERSEVAA